jgi:DNA-directed RNA polymerase specialized sigma24 family protein
MRNAEILALLQDLKAPLVTRGWLWSRRRRHEPLLGRLDAATSQLDGSPHPAVPIARTRLEGAPVLRIDEDETQIEETPEGVWVRGWIWVERQALMSCNAGRMTKLRHALADLPEQTCAVFLAHCVEGLPYPAIALRLNVGVAEVRRELVSALLILSEALDGP